MVKNNDNMNTEEFYRKTTIWRIILSQMNNASAMIFHFLIGMISYLANEGYGILIAVVGIILTVTRVFDGLIDPFIALIIERINTKYGKIRIFLALGWIIRSLAVLMLFVWGIKGNLGIFYFITMYLIYIIGSSLYDIAGNMIPTLMTNDPHQRPLIQVWSTIYSYLVPTIFTLGTALFLLPQFENQYSVALLKLVALVCIPMSLIFTILSCIAISKVDKPENFKSLTNGKEEHVGLKDMIALFKRNKPFQMFLISSVSAKLAQQTMSQAIVTTLFFGILIGNIQLGMTMNTVCLLPSILFAFAGAKYAGKFGNKETVVTWTRISIIISIISILFLILIDTRLISQKPIFMVVFSALLITGTGSKMCVTIANGAMRSDIVDFELDLSGKFMPAVITSTYNFIDQFITSLGAMIATGAIAMIGYSTVAPQPTDKLTLPIKYMTIFLYFGIPILGWIIGLIAMKHYKLSHEEVAKIQKSLHLKKQS